MLKRLHILLLSLLAAFCLTAVAWADYDYIDRYTVTVTPNTEDGSLLIFVELEWTPLEDLPYGQELKIGVPNGSIRDVAALTDNIESLSYDNSYMYVYLTQGYDADETFTFSYSWVQEYMYQLAGSAVTYDYTPGWFDEAKIGQMTLVWNDPPGLVGQLESTGTASAELVRGEDALVCTASNLYYGETMGVAARYENWPVQLSEENSLDNIPSDYDSYEYWEYEDYAPYEDDTGSVLFFVLIVTVIVFIVIAVVKRGDGYSGGFGTHYVFVNHLWYPAGPDGKPRPGSVGTKTRPRPPRNDDHHGGFGGGSRGGGFGGGGFGGGGHCACASSCACACACACAGGGRAGCSAKNLYGIRLDEELSDKI